MIHACIIVFTCELHVCVCSSEATLFPPCCVDGTRGPQNQKCLIVRPPSPLSTRPKKCHLRDLWKNKSVNERTWHTLWRSAGPSESLQVDCRDTLQLYNRMWWLQHDRHKVLFSDWHCQRCLLVMLQFAVMLNGIASPFKDVRGTEYYKHL